MKNRPENNWAPCSPCISGTEVGPGEDPQECLQKALTKLLCKEEEEEEEIEWNVRDIVSTDYYIPWNMLSIFSIF